MSENSHDLPRNVDNSLLLTVLRLDPPLHILRVRYELSTGPSCRTYLVQGHPLRLRTASSPLVPFLYLVRDPHCDSIIWYRVTWAASFRWLVSFI